MSVRKRTHRILAAALALCILAHDGSSPASAASDDSFRWSADVLDSSFRSDTLELLGNVRVTQGTMSIEAQQATADAFRSENSRWQFQNSVRVRTAEAELTSESAAASFRNNQLIEARVMGSPAQFEQRGSAPERSVRGRARNITYDLASDVVTLTGDVWFSYGADEFRGDTVIYSMRDERVRVNPDGDSSGRVKGIIRPRPRSDESPQASNLPSPELQQDIERTEAANVEGPQASVTDESGA
jgi:lipopolysaccharide export system protein LptA